MTIFKLFHKKRVSASKKVSQVDSRKLRPYGDLLGDGAMQLSFTLPIKASPEAREAAKVYVEKLGLDKVHVVSMESMGENLSFFVVYGQCHHSINFTKIKTSKPSFKQMHFDEVMQFARQNLKRKLVVLGATTGTDAHTVGLDAILNMKGYMGDYGLERYQCFKVFNLRSQVSNEELIKQALKFKADVILVSKVVTQRGEYLKELKDLIKLIKTNKRLKSPLLKIAGGPRLDHSQATKLGFDSGFGPGTLPSEVASFIVQEYARRSS